MSDYLINLSNLHTGGGVQVAASFVMEMIQLADIYDLSKLSVICSTSVMNSLEKDIDFSCFYRFDILDVYGFEKINDNDLSLFYGYDKCFTLFGPLYSNIPVRINICGFAQAWICYPQNEAYSMLPIVKRLQYKLKFSIQRKFFEKSDHLVVEADHVKRALEKIGLNSKISVVNNSVSASFIDAGPVVTYFRKQPVLGFIGRAYPHKNLQVLKKVNEILLNKYNFNCGFLFTLDQDEMSKLNFVEKNFVSIGPITLNECRDFYTKIDALIFPSLLECFSVTPLEAMAMCKPVFASDRPFVKNICKDAAYYFDPMDPEDIAFCIVKAFESKDDMIIKSRLGRDLVLGLPSAKSRAKEYLNLLYKG